MRRATCYRAQRVTLNIVISNITAFRMNSEVVMGGLWQVRVVALVYTLMHASLAFAADVDWKMYGSATADAPSFCFYDAKGVAVGPDGYVRVRTKCLLKVDLESVYFKGDRGRQIVDNAAKKVAEGYVPPMVAIGKMSVKQAVDVIAYEESANLGDSEERPSFLSELNCSGRMQRRLGSYVKVNDRADFESKPGDWEYVPLDGKEKNLQEILCPKQ